MSRPARRPDGPADGPARRTAGARPASYAPSGAAPAAASRTGGPEAGAADGPATAGGSRRGGGRRSRRPAAEPTARRGRDARRSGPPGRARERYRRALRREAATIVGVLLDPADLAAMTRYRSFPFPDHRTYLRHLDGMLRGLHRTGVPIALTPFDPEAYDDYCRDTRQPPDTPATRSRYVAEAAGTGALLPYSRRPLTALRADLAQEAERRSTWQRATDLLVAAGTCAECGQDLAHCAFDHATESLLRVLRALGEGPHHLVCSVPDGTAPPLTAAVHVTAEAGEWPRIADSDTLALCTLMAVCAVTDARGGLVARTFHPGGQPPTATVRGWALHGAEPVPLTEAEVFDAYCTDPETGDPVPPEAGIRYAPGLPLPPAPPAGGPA